RQTDALRQRRSALDGPLLMLGQLLWATRRTIFLGRSVALALLDHPPPENLTVRAPLAAAPQPLAPRGVFDRRGLAGPPHPAGHLDPGRRSRRVRVVAPVALVVTVEGGRGVVHRRVEETERKPSKARVHDELCPRKRPVQLPLWPLRQLLEGLPQDLLPPILEQRCNHASRFQRTLTTL